MAGSALGNFFFGAQYAIRRVLGGPDLAQGGKQFNLYAYYRLLWSLYSNDIFEDPRIWGFYRSQYKLYRQIRGIYNPTRRLVDFYAGTIYPGVLTEDANALPDSIPCAIPFPKDTAQPIKDAIARLWAWSNFQSQKAQLVRYGAAAGSVLLEINDDIDSGTISTHVVWPGLVWELDLKPSGELKGYTLRYLAVGDNGINYEYRKVVDAEQISFFRDGKPFDYTGAGASYSNPYGFVPAVWIKHRDIGGNVGAPAIHGSIGKIDELNGLASHIHDQIHLVIGAPKVLWSDGQIKDLLGALKRGPTDDMSVPEADRENVTLLRGPAGGKVDHLAGGLPLKDAMAYIDKIIEEIEQDHPELMLYKELRAMSHVTGPGASRMLGDASAMVVESQANYDQALIRLFQMALQIGGWRANGNGWGDHAPLTTHQQAFLPFDLDSVQRGDLDFIIAPRPLIPVTRREAIDAERAEIALAADKQIVAGDLTGIAQRIQQVAGRSIAAGIEGPRAIEQPG